MGRLSTKNDLLLSAAEYSWAVFDNLGLITTLAGIIGIAAYSVSLGYKHRAWIPYTAVSPFVFNIVSLWLGQTVIVTLHSTPPYYFNVRYGLVALPGAVLFAGYAAHVVSRRAPAVLAAGVLTVVLGTQLLWWLPTWPQAVVTVADGLQHRGSDSCGVTSVVDAAQLVQKTYRGGRVLIDDEWKPLFFQTARLKAREYVTQANNWWWTEALNDPGKHVEWVISGSPQFTDRVYKDANRQSLETDFDLVMSDRCLNVYRVKSAP
jgi:hypothetical protein